MSYDLQVFGEESLTGDHLRALLSDAGLGLDEAEPGSESLAVVRGAKGRYSFTLGLPVSLEPEDVPEEVAAAVLAPSVLYEILVEGSSATEVPHAIRFARRLAQATGGAVLDQQADGVWTKGKLRAVEPVRRGAADIVDVHWYTHPDVAGEAVAVDWLDLARRHLHEALPRRFGPYEPLAMKLDVDGPDAFVTAVAGEETMLFFKATTPCIGGHLAGGARATGTQVHSLTLHRGPLRDERWRDGLRRLFTSFAAVTGTFFASAEVVRGLEWSGQSIAYGATAEKTTYLAPRGQWAGLLPYPAWWTWFGSDYVPLVAQHLPSDQVRELDGGLSYARSDEPVDRDQLSSPRSATRTRALGLRKLWSRGDRAGGTQAEARWLPAELLAAPETRNPLLHNPPLTPARVLPPRLDHRA
jgi:hypothetical protein